jgi:hypothetical protein
VRLADFARITSLLIALGLMAIGIALALDYVRHRNDEEPKPILQESVLVPTANGTTIECLVFDRGVSCNWQAVPLPAPPG